MKLGGCCQGRRATTGMDDMYDVPTPVPSASSVSKAQHVKSTKTRKTKGQRYEQVCPLRDDFDEGDHDLFDEMSFISAPPNRTSSGMVKPLETTKSNAEAVASAGAGACAGRAGTGAAAARKVMGKAVDKATSNKATKAAQVVDKAAKKATAPPKTTGTSSKAAPIKASSVRTALIAADDDSLTVICDVAREEDAKDEPRVGSCASRVMDIITSPVSLALQLAAIALLLFLRSTARSPSPGSSSNGARGDGGSLTSHAAPPGPIGVRPAAATSSGSGGEGTDAGGHTGGTAVLALQAARDAMLLGRAAHRPQPPRPSPPPSPPFSPPPGSNVMPAAPPLPHGAISAASRSVSLPPSPPRLQSPVQRRDGETAATLNVRFAEGRPSNDLASAGVLLRQFDSLGDPANPCLPCPSHLWCGKFSDRWSASLVNSRVRHLYDGAKAGSAVGHVAVARPGGIVLSPSVELFCAYAQDGNSMDEAKVCPGGARGEADPTAADLLKLAGGARGVADPTAADPTAADPTFDHALDPLTSDCTPGCHPPHEWCSEEQQWDCSYPPSRLRDALEYQLSLSCSACEYNEMVVSTRSVTRDLGAAIEAVFYQADSTQHERQQARTAHRKLAIHLRDTYGLAEERAPPLLRLDLRGEGGAEPFSPPQPADLEGTIDFAP